MYKVLYYCPKVGDVGASSSTYQLISDYNKNILTNSAVNEINNIF